MYLADINTTEDEIYVTFSETEDIENHSVYDDFYSIKLSKKDYRENIKIDVIEITPNVDLTKYTDINDISNGKEYSIEQALKENCFVTEAQGYNMINISNDKEMMDKFIENCQNGKSGFIRSAMYGSDNNHPNICDVEFKDGKYYIQFTGIDTIKNEPQVYARIYTKITKKRMTMDGEHYDWWIDVWDDKGMGWTVSMFYE